MRLLIALLLLTGCTSEEVVPAEGTFRALSYNVHGLPETITGDDTSARLEAIGPRLRPFDLAGIQEDWIDDNHDVMFAATDQQSKLRSTMALEDRVYGTGLSILANFPVVETFEALFETCNGFTDGASDCLASKGLFMARLELAPGVFLDLWTTHLEAGGGPEDEAVRQGQAERAVELIGERSDSRALLFVGDFNLHEEDGGADVLALETLRSGLGLSDTCGSVDCPEPGRIDRIWFRSAANLLLAPAAWDVAPGFEDAEGVPLSDHDPIEGTFAWQEVVVVR